MKPSNTYVDRGPAADDGPTERAHGNASAEPPLRTRAGLAWIALCTAALMAAAFLVFIVQNTQSVHVSFLWFDGITSLASAVLVSVVGASIVTLVFGAARIMQLRHALKHRT